MTSCPHVEARFLGGQNQMNKYKRFSPWPEGAIFEKWMVWEKGKAPSPFRLIDAI
jgi:hypothetical protein